MKHEDNAVNIRSLYMRIVCKTIAMKCANLILSIQVKTYLRTQQKTKQMVFIFFSLETPFSCSFPILDSVSAGKTALKLKLVHNRGAYNLNPTKRTAVYYNIFKWQIDCHCLIIAQTMGSRNGME